jgi:hypothetical protein
MRRKCGRSRIGVDVSRLADKATCRRLNAHSLAQPVRRRLDNVKHLLAKRPHEPELRLFAAQARLAVGDSLSACGRARAVGANLPVRARRHVQTLRSFFSEPGIESLLLMSAD